MEEEVGETMRDPNQLRLLSELWGARDSLRAIVQRKEFALRDMTIREIVWFNVAIGAILELWNQGNVLLRDQELLSKVRDRFSAAISDDDWRTALNTFCLPNIKGAMHLLLFTSDDDRFIIFYPGLKRFMDSDLGRQFGPALEMLYGFDPGPLRRPEAGIEAKWVQWLETSFARG